VKVEREHEMRIVHNLIAAPGVKLAQIKRVLSHPVALAQCREFLRKQPQMRAEPFYDTAGSVKHIMEAALRDTAGIASTRAVAQYGATLLKAGIEDDKQNFTRFFIVKKNVKPQKDANKTSVAFVLKNQPGVLFKALSVFALRDISLSKIESRPMRGRPWEYVFYVDLLRGDDEAARNALKHLDEIAEYVKVLGVYVAARK
jgi:prephenate dehydratase